MTTIETTRRSASALRRPGVDDAADVLALVRASPLDANSLYYYLLWCRDFATTSLVAESDGRLTGFVTGYLRPDDPAVWFAWQSAVAPDAPEPGLALRLFGAAVEQAREQGARWIETSVDPTNRAVIMMLRKLAAALDAPVETSILFAAEDMEGGHPPEMLYRIGPIPG